MSIKNGEGRVTHEGDRSKQLCDLDLRNAVFEGLALEEAHLDDSNLEGANLRGPIYIGAISFSRISLKPTHSVSQSRP